MINNLLINMYNNPKRDLYLPAPGNSITRTKSSLSHRGKARVHPYKRKFYNQCWLVAAMAYECMTIKIIVTIYSWLFVWLWKTLFSALTKWHQNKDGVYIWVQHRNKHYIKGTYQHLISIIKSIRMHMESKFKKGWVQSNNTNYRHVNVRFNHLRYQKRENIIDG